MSKASMYLRLFHGRNEATEDMQDWGFQGPLIGPLTSIQGTYTAEISITNGIKVWIIPYHEDMIQYDGKFYGDWCVVTEDDVPAEAILPPLGDAI